MALPTWGMDSHAMFQPETLQPTCADPNNLYTPVFVPSRGKGWQQSLSGTKPGGGGQGKSLSLGGSRRPDRGSKPLHLLHCPFTLHLQNANSKIKLLGIQYNDCRLLSPSVSFPLCLPCWVACEAGPEGMRWLWSEVA